MNAEDLYKTPERNSNVDDDLLRGAYYYNNGAEPAGEMYVETMTQRKKKSQFWLRHYDESYPDVDEHKFELRPITYNCWSLRLFEAYLASPETYAYDDCRVEVTVWEPVSLDDEINDFGLKLLFKETKYVDTDQKKTFNPL